MSFWSIQILRLVGRLGSRKPVNPTSWETIVVPTDCPKSVRNRCVIEVFDGVFVLSRCFLDFSVGIDAFVIGLSQISFFFSCKHQCHKNHYYDCSTLFPMLVTCSACHTVTIAFCIFVYSKICEGHFW